MRSLGTETTGWQLTYSLVQERSYAEERDHRNRECEWDSQIAVRDRWWLSCVLDKDPIPKRPHPDWDANPWRQHWEHEVIHRTWSSSLDSNPDRNHRRNERLSSDTNPTDRWMSAWRTAISSVDIRRRSSVTMPSLEEFLSAQVHRFLSSIVDQQWSDLPRRWTIYSRLKCCCRPYHPKTPAEEVMSHAIPLCRDLEDPYRRFRLLMTHPIALEIRKSLGSLYERRSPSPTGTLWGIDGFVG